MLSTVRARWLSRVLGWSGTALLTLASGCQEPYLLFDQDGDGVPAGEDCDETSAEIGRRYLDADGDGYGTGEPLAGCALATGTADAAGDCDDASSLTNPGAPEICDLADNNCDGAVDEGFVTTYYPDDDLDGFGDSSAPITSCSPPEGAVSVSGDCNDLDSQVYSGREEQCDGKDNDCNETIDDGVQTVWYVDADGDGHGVPGAVEVACTQPEGHADNDQDCNDTDPLISPSQEEVVCNGVDENCTGNSDDTADLDGDGFDRCDPNVPGTDDRPADCDDTSAASFPGALEICDGYDNNCNGGFDEGFLGVYLADFDGDGFGNEQVRACAPGANFVRSRGDCNDDDPEIHPGAADATGDGIDQDCGGSEGPEPHVGLSGSSSTIAQALSKAVPGATIWVGPGEYQERGLSFAGKAVQLRSTHFADATSINAALGGRIFSFAAGETRDTVVDGLSLRNGSIEDADGGGVYILQASPTLRDCVFVGNTTDSDGGAIAIEGGSPLLERLLIVDNTAARGAGVFVTSGSPILSHLTVAMNLPETIGGGVVLESGSSATIQASILAYNAGYNLQLLDDTASLELSTSVLFTRQGLNYSLSSLPSDSDTFDPGFVRICNFGDSCRRDYRLRPGSQAADFILDGSTDFDGSPAQAGAYGGEDGDWFYYQDSEGDGLYDGWEMSHGLDPSADDSAGDGDADGASNLSELREGIDPEVADTDADGYLDGVEFDAQSDPNDAFKRPGDQGLRVARVPTDFPTVADAVAAIDWAGIVELQAGSYNANLSITNRDVTLRATKDTLATLSGQGERVLLVQWSTLRIIALELINGSALSGGALRLQGVEAELQHVTLAESSATVDGGALSARYSNVLLSDCTFDGNSATGRGGSLAFQDGTLEMVDSTVQYSDSEGGGGAVILNSDATIDTSTFFANDAGGDGGGALRVVNSTLTLSNSDVSSNDAESGGAGIYAENASLTVLDTDIVDNFSSNNPDGEPLSLGAGVLGAGSILQLTGVFVSNNIAAEEGGGLAAEDGSTLELYDSDVADNEGDVSGGGVYVGEDSSATISRTLFSYNNVEDGFGGGLRGQNASLVVSDCLFEYNTADSGGGGIAATYSTLDADHVAFEGNSTISGGAIRLEYATADLAYLLARENTARGYGGAIASYGSSFALTQATVVSNESQTTGFWGGGIYVQGTSGDSVTVENTILAYNSRYNFYKDTSSPPQLVVKYTDLYAYPNEYNHNLGTLDSSNLTVDPYFQVYDPSLTPTDVHLSLLSSISNSGNPETLDVDGSRAQLGMYGGPEGDQWDRDRDEIQDYFWPGGWFDPPSGFASSSYDCRDDDDSIGNSCL